MEPEPERRTALPEPAAETEGCEQPLAKTGSPTPQDLATTADDLAAEVLEDKEQLPTKAEIHTESTTARNSEEKPDKGSDEGPEEEPEKTPSHGPAAGAVHSVVPRSSKRVIILLVACAGVFSPLTSAIYLPALNSIADDLKVKTSYINLSITTCKRLLPQALTPFLVAS